MSVMSDLYVDTAGLRAVEGALGRVADDLRACAVNLLTATAAGLGDVGLEAACVEFVDSWSYGTARLGDAAARSARCWRRACASTPRSRPSWPRRQRHDETFPALGFDPAPGELAAVDALCSALQRSLQTLVGSGRRCSRSAIPAPCGRARPPEPSPASWRELSPHLEQAQLSHRAAHAAASDLGGRPGAASARRAEAGGPASVAQRTVLVAGQAAEHAASRARTALVVGADVAAAASAASASARRLHAAEQELADVRSRPVGCTRSTASRQREWRPRCAARPRPLR